MRELKRIFYVEDEPDIMAVAQLVLQDVGGFELGTSSYINPIPPSESVRILKTF